MNAQSFLENFGHLANAPDGVEKLRELLLCLAMQGRLVNRMTKIRQSKLCLRLIENEKLNIDAGESNNKHPKDSADQSTRDPHEIPIGWKWVRFGNLQYYNGRQKPSINDPKHR